MPAELVEIVVYDAPPARRGGCGCGCGHHGGEGGHSHGPGRHQDGFDQISMAMQSRALALTLGKEFPGKVRVEYINVLEDPRGPALPQTKLLCSLTYPPPLVYLNGKGRFAGALPVERIREEVKNLLAAGTD
uniref:Thioredoxin family protein n=1 Tax=Desulfobacca acetoxidans TaxID=60893 RepID=A0A7C3Z4S5_9BACT